MQTFAINCKSWPMFWGCLAVSTACVADPSLFACKENGIVRVQSTPCAGQAVAQEKRPLTAGEAFAAQEAKSRAAHEADVAERKARDAELKENAPYSCADQSMIGTEAYELERRCGTPLHKNVSGGTHGSREQWVYRNDVYLYVENGRMTSFQNRY